MQAVMQIGVFLILSLVFYGPSSFAEVGSTSSASSSSTGRPDKSLFDSVALEYSNTFIGPSLSDPTANYNYNDEAEDHRGALELENAIHAGYKFNSDVTLGLVTKWNMHSNASTGQAFELKDPYVKVSHSRIFSARNFKFEADFRISAPASEQSRTNGLVTSIASEQVATYDIPRSRFTLELTTFIQNNFHREIGDPQEGDRYELHFSPGVEYRFSDAVLANVLFEASKTQSRFADLAARREEGYLIETGVVWAITENVDLNPNIHTRTSRPLAANSFTFGAKLNWTLL